MQPLSKKFIFTLFTTMGLLLGTVVAAAPAVAQEGATNQATPDLAERPFQLPFAQPPGPDTWLMAQPYGNTTGAYRQRFTTYGASGGIHFGVDLSAPCGTEIVSIADGVVFAIDGPYGSPPHNLMIDHPELGYASMYGHLLEAPNLTPGQIVKQGQVVAKVGDSGETCYSRPHLHLEIRDLAHIRKYNPTLLIDANWDSLAMIGDSGRDFARDLNAPRKWQSLYDQPVVQTGGPIVNDFSNPWPLDWKRSVVSRNLPILAANQQPARAESPDPTPALIMAAGRQLTTGDCCTSLAWSPTSTAINFIDQPNPNSLLGRWAVNVTQPMPSLELVTTWLGLYSPDERLVAYPDTARGVTVIERLADGQSWEIDTQEQRPAFTPDSRQIMWTVYNEDAPRDTRVETVWLANVDGSNARIILQAARTDIAGWMDSNTLLLTRRVAGGSDETLLALSLASGRQTELVTVPEPRGMAVSPDGRYLVYYTRFEPGIDNGLWLLDLDSASLLPQKLPFFGAYRWRDGERLIYMPFDPTTTEHNFFEYNVTSSANRALFPNGTNLTVANNDWRISPDGSKIALLAANQASLNGIWVLDIE